MKFLHPKPLQCSSALHTVRKHGLWLCFQLSHNNLKQVTTTCAPAFALPWRGWYCQSGSEIESHWWILVLSLEEKREKGKRNYWLLLGLHPLLPTPMSLTDSSIPQEFTPVLPVWETAWLPGFWFTLPVKHETNSRKAWIYLKINQETKDWAWWVQCTKNPRSNYTSAKCSMQTKHQLPLGFNLPCSPTL